MPWPGCLQVTLALLWVVLQQTMQCCRPRRVGVLAVVPVVSSKNCAGQDAVCFALWPCLRLHLHLSSLRRLHRLRGTGTTSSQA